MRGLNAAKRSGRPQTQHVLGKNVFVLHVDGSGFKTVGNVLCTLFRALKNPDVLETLDDDHAMIVPCDYFGHKTLETVLLMPPAAFFALAEQEDPQLLQELLELIADVLLVSVVEARVQLIRIRGQVLSWQGLYIVVFMRCYANTNS